MHTIRQILLASFAIAALVGCAGGPELLLTPGGSEPPGVDLSGYWRLLNDSSDPLRQYSRQGFIGPRSTERVIRLTKEIRRAGTTAAASRRNDRDRAALAQVFLETGDDVKVTQTADGLFISYDRSVVEEYIFGEHRIATVGPISAERASGWQGTAYVVETLDEDKVLLRERWSLTEGGETLQRDVEFFEKDELVFSAKQAFERTDGPGPADGRRDVEARRVHVGLDPRTERGGAVERLARGPTLLV